jgi:hypothetical protein
MSLPDFWADILLSSREISEPPVPVADGYAAGLYRQGLDDHGTQRIKIDLLPVPRDATSRDVVGNLASLVTVEEQYEIALWSYEDEEDRCILLTVHPIGPDAVEVNTFYRTHSGWQTLSVQRVDGGTSR